jgi:hypothetical protein
MFIMFTSYLGQGRAASSVNCLCWLLGTSTAKSFRKSPRARLEVVASVDEISHVLRALANRLKTAIGRWTEGARPTRSD